MRGKRAFYEGLASLLGAGIPLDRALRSLQGDGRGAGALAAPLAAAVAAGGPLADGMASLPDAFEAIEVELVRAGEASGGLDRALRALAAREEARARVRGRIVAGCTYPALVLLLVPVPLHVPALVRSGAGAFLLRYAATVAPAVLLVVALVLARRSAAGRAALDAAVLRLPWFGALARDLAWVRWARAMAALEDAGLPPRRAAEHAAAAAGRAALTAPLLAAAERLDAGATRAGALAGTGLPPALLQAVATGEVAGDLPRQLESAAAAIEVAAEARLAATLAALPVVATVLAGAAVLAVAWNVMGGFYGQALR